MLNTISKFISQKRTAFDLSIILLFSILACLPILLNGIPSSMDIPQQYQLAQSFYDSILNGQVYPGWADQPNYGYGDVSVRFYPLLAYYILSFFRYLSGNWFDASCLFFITLYFVSGIGVYFFARENSSPAASLFAAIAYIWLPYHILEIYIGSLFAESTAMAILPFCLLFINRVCRNGRLIDICGLAVSFGLILISHLPTSIIASMTLLIYSLFTINWKNYLKNILKLAVSVFFSFLMSSFYLVKIITEMNNVQHATEAYSTGTYSYKGHFILSYLFPFAEIRTSSPSSLMNLTAVISIAVLIPGMIFYFRRKKKDKINSLTNVATVTIFSFIMATPLSIFIWELLPILQKIQFPFRWLTIFTLGTAIFAAEGFKWATECFKTPKRYVSFLIFGLLLFCFVFDYFKMMNSELTYPRTYFNGIVSRFKPMPSYKCWWTVWAKGASNQNDQNSTERTAYILGNIAADNRTFEIKDWSAIERSFVINEGEAENAVVATLYYPHWKATVNGQPVEVTSGETGLINIPIPAEKADVRLYFQEPPHIITAFYISGFAWIISLLALAFGLFKQTNHLKFTNKNE